MYVPTLASRPAMHAHATMAGHGGACSEPFSKQLYAILYEEQMELGTGLLVIDEE